MKVNEKLFKYIFLCCAAFSILAVLLICGFLFTNGLPAIKKIGFFDFLFGTKWKPSNELFGIFPMIIGSLYVTTGAIIFGVPIGLLTAVFLSKFCPKKLYKLIKPAIDLLAGIPSVVYGFFGLMVIVPIVRQVFGGNGSSILTASILLGMMILPTIINISESSLNAVPQSYYEAARALAVCPEVLLMDEPTSALDPISTSKIEDCILELKEKYTIVIVTHNMQQAVRISDKTVFFLLGEIIEEGDTQDMSSKPKMKKTEDYITGRFG